MSAQPILSRLPWTSASTLLIARRPIHDRWKRVVAYELLFRGSGRGDVDHERGNARVIVETFTRIGAPALVGRHPAHVRASRSFLLDQQAFALPPELVVLEVAAPDPPTRGSARRSSCSPGRAIASRSRAPPRFSSRRGSRHSRTASSSTWRA